MLFFVSFCTHKKPNDILVVNAKSEIEDLIKFHSKFKSISLDSISDELSSSFDLVIINDYCSGDAIFAEINRVLRDDGVCVVESLNYSDSKDEVKSQLVSIGKEFIIAMPYRVDGRFNILASKKYHPTADIILQRSDLLDGLTYYSTEMHMASFALPKYIEKELLGINKR
jgi:spermidine synthase